MAMEKELKKRPYPAGQISCPMILSRDLLDASERAHLKCHFSSLLLHPFYRLGPIKVEMAHRPPHQVIVFHDFLSHAEADEIVEQGRPRLARASVGKEKLVSDLRVAKSAWLEDGIGIVDKMSLRINLVTGLQSARKFDRFGEGKEEEYELLQVSSYNMDTHKHTICALL